MAAPVPGKNELQCLCKLGSGFKDQDFLDISESIERLKIPERPKELADIKNSRFKPDVWLKPEVKPDGFKYYAIVLCYVDDVISIGHQPMAAIEQPTANLGK